MRHELLLGAGASKDKRIRIEESPGDTFESPTTLDIQEPADIIHDLNDHILPIASNSYDEIHAYEILEHLGKQGDWQFFFDQFREFWRVLKPNGLFCFSVPEWDSHWSYSDPGHTRVLPKHTFAFLTAEHYEQVGNKSSCTNYRAALGDQRWEVLGMEDTQHQLFGILKALK